MKVSTTRTSHQASGNKLRRARHLFIFFQRNHLKTQKQLWNLATVMRANGLYAPITGLKDVRFAILRALWRLEGGRYGSWHRWLNDRGWLVGSWSNHWIRAETKEEQEVLDRDTINYS